jgi:hypothetical protein
MKRVVAMAARAMRTKVLYNKEGGDDGGKSNGGKDGRQVTASATMCTIVMAMRADGNWDSG